MEQEKHTTKKRKWKQISEKERYKIEALFGQGLTPAQIAASLEPKRDRRTIERELKRGMVQHMRTNPNTSKSASEPLHIVEEVYLADVGQRKHDEKAANKGRGLKIGHDHALARYLEQKTGEEKWSPDAAIGAITAQGLKFSVSICTKTVYNMIDRGDFLNITNKDLWVKKDNKKRNYKKTRTVALNNRNGKSITERPKEADERTEQGHWEIDLVVGKQGTKPVILTLDFLQNSTIKIANTANQVKTQSKTFTAVAITVGNYFKSFDETYHMLIQNAFA